MGVRLSKNLLESDFRVSHIEPGAGGRARLKDELGIECVDVDTALDNVDVVILAIPDTLIGRLAHEIAPKLKPRTMVMTLDAAAPFAGHLPDRKDLTYFVAHPCHPTIFNDETSEAARNDHFGGSAARQSISSALMQGPVEAFDVGEAVAKVITASDACCRSFSTMTACTASPHLESGTRITATSLTFGCSPSAASTSEGCQASASTSASGAGRATRSRLDKSLLSPAEA